MLGGDYLRQGLQRTVVRFARNQERGLVLCVCAHIGHGLAGCLRELSSLIQDAHQSNSTTIALGVGSAAPEG